MRLGVVFPQTEIEADPVAVRDFAQAAEDLGFTHLVAYDHVLGADPSSRPGWSGPYTHETPFHEPLVLFGFLAGVTRRLELVSGILVLPQRQTALVAKQAAEVDVLSSGRLRLGVAVGWNAVEYEALGADFATRGRRLNEQITVLRALWTDPVVTVAGRFHRIAAAGLNPLPVQRPIPIWIGGHADAALTRAARLGDGWMPGRPADDELRAMVERLRELTRRAGRDPDAVPVEGRPALAGVAEAAWPDLVERWREVGAASAALNTMGMGLHGAQAHLDVLARAARVLGL